jgi:5'-3' exonuclease
MSENALLEHMYLLISILKNYSITPIFIFDGKPPPEKKVLLHQRKLEKKEAQEKYNLLEKTLLENLSEERREEILFELEQLKRQFVKIKEDDVVNVKALMDAYGVTYYTSTTEADQLCAYFVKKQKAWACLSDDMDMFLYGCNRVIRHISLIHHTVIYYDMEIILKDLQMSEQNFREIMVVSGTDYNLNTGTSLFDTMQYYQEYNKYVFNGTMNKTQGQSFYDWLVSNTKYIENENQLRTIYNMFIIDNYDADLAKFLDENEKPNNTINNEIDMVKLQEILKKEGFIF